MSVHKAVIHAFNCAYIMSWMHLRSLESAEEPRVALGCDSSNSYASFMLSKLHKTMYANTNQFLNIMDGSVSERSSVEVGRLYKSVNSLGYVKIPVKSNNEIFRKLRINKKRLHFGERSFRALFSPSDYLLQASTIPDSFRVSCIDA